MSKKQGHSWRCASSLLSSLNRSLHQEAETQRLLSLWLDRSGQSKGKDRVSSLHKHTFYMLYSPHIVFNCWAVFCDDEPFFRLMDQLLKLHSLYHILLSPHAWGLVPMPRQLLAVSGTITLHADEIRKPLKVQETQNWIWKGVNWRRLCLSL